MNRRRHARIKAVFIEAAGLAPHDRTRFIEQACAGDAALLSEVESLLAHHDPKTIVAASEVGAPPSPASADAARRTWTWSSFVPLVLAKLGPRGQIAVGAVMALLALVAAGFSGHAATIARGVLPALFAISLVVIVAFRLSIMGLRREVSAARRMGQYAIEDQIGEGGMARVFRARHVLLKRPTAIKLLKPEQATPEMLARFEREVQLACQLTHPNTIEIYDYGRTPEGVFYCAMELVSGWTLAQLVAFEGALPPARVVYLLRQVCGSLGEAHGLGLVHRDVKPQNLMLCQRGGDSDVVKVLDFGLVRSVDAPDSGLDSARMSLAGTPLYMAPERLLDPLATDPRSDIYSLGAVGFLLLTGKDVFLGDDAVDILRHALDTPAPHPAEVVDTATFAELDGLIVACLAKNPADRPRDVDQVTAILDGVKLSDHWDQTAARRWWAENATRSTGCGAGQPTSDVE